MYESEGKNEKKGGDKVKQRREREREREKGEFNKIAFDCVGNCKNSTTVLKQLSLSNRKNSKC